MKNKLLLIFVLVSVGFCSMGQTYRIRESKGTLYLLDSTGTYTLDTLSSYNFFIPKKNGIWIFNLVHARQADHCRTEYLFVDNIEFSQGKFRIIEKNKVTIKNDKCGRLVGNKDYYCFYFDELSINDSRITVIFSDSDEMAAKRIISIYKNFQFSYFKKHLCKELYKYPKFNECYSCF
jgi:hypothetical protein